MTMTRARKQPNSFKFISWKHSLHLLFFLIFVTVFSYILYQYRNPQHFPIKAVKIFGAEHLDRTVLQQSLKPLVKHGFFNVDVDAIKDNLIANPWVSAVNVRRVWPDEIQITILEKNPIAYWNEATLLSAKGEIFSPDLKSMLLPIPKLVGPDGRQLYVMQYYYKLNSLLEPLHFKIARLELTENYLWHVTLSNGIKVTAANKDILTRLSHFVKVYPKIIGVHERDIDYVDLRYSNGLAVKWKLSNVNV